MDLSSLKGPCNVSNSFAISCIREFCRAGIAPAHRPKLCRWQHSITCMMWRLGMPLTGCKAPKSLWQRTPHGGKPRSCVMHVCKSHAFLPTRDLSLSALVVATLPAAPKFQEPFDLRVLGKPWKPTAAAPLSLSQGHDMQLKAYGSLSCLCNMQR